MFISSLSRRRGGFTLVELLVVIGIIAVLIGILLPALNRARRAAKTTQCLSNTRQLAMGAIQYWNDNKGSFSPYYAAGGEPPAPFQISWMQQFAKPETYNKVRFCPEATEPNPHSAYQPTGAVTGTDPGPNMPGTATNCWGPYGRAMRHFAADGRVVHMTGSYMFNGYLLKKHPSGLDDTLDNGNNAGNLERLWIPPVKRNTEVPVICDGIWPTGWPKEGDAVPPNLYAPAGATLDINNSNWHRNCIARHGMAINVAFMDGHATTVELPNLWKLPWHRLWKVPTTTEFNTIRGQIRTRYKG